MLVSGSIRRERLERERNPRAMREWERGRACYRGEKGEVEGTQKGKRREGGRAGGRAHRGPHKAT